MSLISENYPRKVRLPSRIRCLPLSQKTWVWSLGITAERENQLRQFSSNLQMCYSTLSIHHKETKKIIKRINEIKYFHFSLVFVFKIVFLPQPHQYRITLVCYITVPSELFYPECHFTDNKRHRKTDLSFCLWHFGWFNILYIGNNNLQIIKHCRWLI